MAKEKKHWFVIGTKKEKTVKKVFCASGLHKRWVILNGSEIPVKVVGGKNMGKGFFWARQRKGDEKVLHHISEIKELIRNKRRRENLQKKYYARKGKVPPKKRVSTRTKYMRTKNRRKNRKEVKP